MKLLSLLKELSLNPKNAEEMKGLILQLALDGKLSTNSGTNEYEIGELIEFTKNGFTGKPNDDGLGLLRLGIECVTQSSGLDINIGMAKYREIPEDKKSKYFVKKGDIFVCRQNGNLHFVGKAGYYLGEDDKFIFSDSLIQLRPKNDLVQSEFLALSMSGIRARIQIEKFCSTTAGNYSINGTNLKTVKLRVPSIEEQKVIVEVVNLLFAEVEQLEELTKERISLKEDFVTSALRRLTESDNTTQEWNYLQQHFSSFFIEKKNIKSLRETILQLAVEGKLTAKWRDANPNTEPASELLKRIEVEKQQLIAEKKIKKEKPLSPIEDEDKPYDLPESWVWCRLGSITTIKGGKRLPKGEKLTREDTGRVYIRVTDMKNGTIDETDLHYVTEDVFKIISKYIIEREDLYLTIVGATIGKLGLIPSKFHGMNLTENAARIIKYKVSKDFMYLTMISKVVQGQFFDKTNQVGVPKLALHRVAKTLFPLPPLKEQQAIVEKANSLLALCDELEQQVDNSQTQVEQLMQSCLKEVFEQESN